jgi:threonine/homoserine/homoserine lactone efflux protein
MEPKLFSAYVVMMALLAASPGPAVVYCMRTGLSGKKDRVFAAVAGLNTGSLVWFSLALFTLNLLFTTLPWVLIVLSLGGGGYLFFIAYEGLASGFGIDKKPLKFFAFDQDSLWIRYKQGFFIQLFNPKALLFFTAVLPPFLDRSRPVIGQLGVMALTTLFLDLVFMSAYGLLALGLVKRLNTPKWRQKFDLICNAILMVLAILILFKALNDAIKIYV